MLDLFDFLAGSLIIRINTQDIIQTLPSLHILPCLRQLIAQSQQPLNFLGFLDKIGGRSWIPLERIRLQSHGFLHFGRFLSHGAVVGIQIRRLLHQGGGFRLLPVFLLGQSTGCQGFCHACAGPLIKSCRIRLRIGLLHDQPEFGFRLLPLPRQIKLFSQFQILSEAEGPFFSTINFPLGHLIRRQGANRLLLADSFGHLLSMNWE